MIEATENSLSILEAIHELDGGGITAIAKETGLAKSTVHDHVETLEERGYLVRSGDELAISFQFLRLGLTARRRLGYGAVAERKVAELADRTGERAHYVVEEHGRGVFLYSETGESAVRTDVHPGDFVPLYATASGKAILAYLPEPKIETVITDDGLSAATENTVVDAEVLRAELEEIRSRGLAYNDGEYVRGLWSVGAPVFDDDDRILGSMSVSVPTNRLRHDGVTEALAATLLETVNEFELDVAYG